MPLPSQPPRHPGLPGPPPIPTIGAADPHAEAPAEHSLPMQPPAPVGYEQPAAPVIYEQPAAPVAYEQPPVFTSVPESVYEQPFVPAEPVYVEEPQATHDEAGVFVDPAASGLTPEVIAMGQMLLQIIGDDESSEIIINGPNEVLQKISGARYHVPNIQFGDAATYHAVINRFLLPFVDTKDRIDENRILVEGQLELPSGQAGVPPILARVHILCPPLVQFAKVTIAKKARYEYNLDRIASTGAMTPPMAEFLKAVAHGKCTVVVSGPTGSGKTTLLQALSHHYDQNDRLIVVEDTPELRLPLADVVYLCSTNSKPGLRQEDVVTTEWLVQTANRMRMDRIIVGECRGAEIAEWLIAANSGAEGSATTVHADNPRRALDKILALATKSPTAGSEMTLRREIAATIDIIIQAGLIDGRHVITHIEEISNSVRQDTGVIATTTLFQFDRTKGTHVVSARPSDDLVNTLRQRGVPINPEWFRGSAS